MTRRLRFLPIAEDQLASLESTDQRRYRKVQKTLGMLEHDPRHPGLNSHRYEQLDGVHGEKIWESYVENNTPGAFRVFWLYGPGEAEITIVAITPHP